MRPNEAKIATWLLGAQTYDQIDFRCVMVGSQSPKYDTGASELTASRIVTGPLGLIV